MIIQGKFEDMSAEATKLFMLDTFEGVRLDWQRPMGGAGNFAVNHLLHLQVCVCFFFFLSFFFW